MKTFILFIFYFILSVNCFSKQSDLSSVYTSGFIENKGQIIDQNGKPNTSLLYLGASPNLMLQLKKNAFSYEVRHYESNQNSNTNPKLNAFRKHSKEEFSDSVVVNSHRIDIALLGANETPEIIAENRSNNYLNYYTTGTPVEGVTYVYQYKKIIYKDIYPNIDLEFITNESDRCRPFKYNFIVKPNGHISDIKLKYSGALDAKLMDKQILLETAFGNLTEAIPQSYIIETGRDIPITYYQSGENTFGFSPTVYPVNQTLLIDPWATYFGGGGDDWSYSVATDKSDNIIAVGATKSLTNIATVGAHQTTFGGGSLRDGFIAKFNSAGQLLWATYFGGSSSDECYSVAADSFNNIVVGGYTSSTGNIATQGAFQDTLNGNGFIAKFSALGTRLWGTYYDVGTLRTLCLDISGDIIIGGDASIITNLATPGAYQQTNGGNNDGFIAKFSSGGSRLWCTYFGGSDVDECWGVATDLSKNILVTGYTYSTTGIATTGAYQTIKSPADNAFLAKFTSSGAIIWSTYYGGNDGCNGYFVSSDSDGNVTMIGETASSTNIASLGAFKTSLSADGQDAFIVKFDATGNRLWATYYGGDGSNGDHPQGIVADKNGSIIFAGGTSSANGIATVGTYQPIYGGNYDGFIVKFNSAGGRLWGSYFGGTQGDGIGGVALSPNGNIAVAGATISTANIATIGSYQPVFGGGSNTGDAFIACFDSTGHIPPVGTQNFNEPTSSILIVYPNPAKEELIIQLLHTNINKGKIIITDVIGKTVKNITVKSANITVNIKEFVTGIYFLTYQDGEVCETVKFVKE